MRLKLANLKFTEFLGGERGVILYDHTSHPPSIQVQCLNVITNLISMDKFFNINIDVDF